MSIDEHRIWRLDPEERAFVQEQTPEEQRNCRLFFAGVDLFFHNVNSRPRKRSEVRNIDGD